MGLEEIHKLLSGLGLVEGTGKVASGSDAVLLLHAAHLHTHVTGLDNHHDTQRVERLLYALFDLKRHALLHLQAVAEYVDHTGYLRQSRDIAVGDIGHMHLAIKRQHVVLAE